MTTPLLVVLATMLIFATAVRIHIHLLASVANRGHFMFQHVAVDIQRVLNAFLNPERSALDYLEILDDPLYTVKNTIFICQVLLGDGFLVRSAFPLILT